MKMNIFLSALTVVCLLFSFTAQAQNAATGTVAALSPESKPAYKVALFEKVADRPDYQDLVTESVSLRLDYEKLNEVFAAHPKQILFEIPTADGSVLQVAAQEQNIFAEGFKVTTSDGKDFAYTPGIYYSGKVVGHEDHCFASISIFNNEVMAVVSFGDYNYNLGPTGQEHGEEYVFYRDADMINQPVFECGVNDYIESNQEHPDSGNRSPTCHRVKMYIEADYELYQGNSSNTATTANFVTGLFASMAMLYQNIGIQLHISQLYVYTGPDPYNDTNASAKLTDFKNVMNVTGYNGDLAHLFSGDNHTSGQAESFTGLCSGWMNGCCVTAGLQMATGTGNTTGGATFPAYSWPIYGITHETGHLLGSQHTHACVWGPNQDHALDYCSGYTELGNCPAVPNPPFGGGTIMSYCENLTSVGVNFANDFGSEPGARIFNYVNNANCLNCSQSGILDNIAITPIFCGTNATYNTVNGSGSTTTYANVSSYNGCPWNESGPERIFSFNLVNPTSVTISIGGLQDELDIFLLSSLNPASCFYWDDNEITATLSPGTYYIVVDGRDGAISSFQLSFTCSGYCQAAGYSNSNAYIQSFELNNILSITGNNNGYYLNQALAGQVQRGTNQDWFLLSVGYTGSYLPLYCRVFMDLNVDHDFEDEGESVYYAAIQSNGFTGGYISIPASVPHTITRMRVIVSQNAEIISCNTFFNGEVEDYYVEILPFCDAQGSTVDEYIDEVTVGNLHQYSGNNFGYTDYTTDDDFRQMPKGQYIPVSLVAGFTNIPYYENFRIWIDFNGNGDFDADEMVFEGLAQGSAPLEGNIYIPETTPSGITGMRISMKYGAMPDGCPNGYYMGETEDYMIEIVPYCPSELKSGYSGSIYRVQINTLDNQSGPNGGYKDFTNLPPVQMTAGETANYAFQSYDGDVYFWSVYMDLNNDKIFDQGEQILATQSANPTGVFNVPSGFLYNTVVPIRISRKQDYYPPGCFVGDDMNSIYGRIGETEDYMAQIVIPCAPPATSTVFLQSETSAVIQWEKSNFATKYQMRYRQTGTTTWTTLSFTGNINYKILTNLLPNTTYEYIVRTLCNGAYTPWSVTWNFTMTPVAACQVPAATLAVPVSSTKENVYWEVIGAAGSYQFRYREYLFGGTWITKSTTPPTIKLKALLPGTIYAYQVRGRCGNVYTDWTPEAYFITLNSGLAPEQFVDPEANNNQVENIVVQPTIFPNPATESFRLDMAGLLAKEATMLSIDGRAIQSLTPEMLENEIDISELQTGTYLVQIITEEGEVVVLRFIKM